MKSIVSKTAGILVLLSVLLSVSFTGKKNKGAKKSNDDYKVAAYVWASTHHDERFGDMLWPEGTGEWEIIKKGNPRFEGHYQPKVPLWGYEPDNDPKVMEKWIDAATDHGVDIFIFDWYWFDDGPFLESSLNDGFLKASNNEEMQFYLMWANHDVKRNYWNVHKFKDDDSQLWEGAVDMKNFEIIVDRVIDQYFSKPNYFKIDGKPVFSIFALWNLVEGFGSLEKTREALDYFRDETVKAGFEGLHIQLIGMGDPDEDLVGRINKLGINSITKYNWGGPHPQDYIQWGTEAMQRREQWDKALDIPYFPNVSIGWDDTPRFPAKGKKDIVYYNKTPEAFAGFLEQAKEYCAAHPDETNLITIFSWNEWIEGGYLLPDIKYGFEYLEAVEEVMSGEYNPYPKR
ncbi:MAG: glycoside hydrolase family 99-like domain-containing protein [Prolixibacteraceae bacterium]